MKSTKVTPEQQEAIDYINSLTKQELIAYMYKWSNLARNPNEAEIKTWSRKDIARCIITDIKLGV